MARILQSNNSHVGIWRGPPLHFHYFSDEFSLAVNSSQTRSQDVQDYVAAHSPLYPNVFACPISRAANIFLFHTIRKYQAVCLPAFHGLPDSNNVPECKVIRLRERVSLPRLKKLESSQSPIL